MERIERFLSAEENENYVLQDGPLLEEATLAIRIQNANLSWNKKTQFESDADIPISFPNQKDYSNINVSEVEMAETNKTIHDGTTTINRSENTLIGIDLSIKRGQLVAVVGPVGSGKSSLLHALLGDLHLSDAGVLFNIRTCHSLTRNCHNLIRTCHNFTRTCHNLTRTCHNLTRTCHNLTRTCHNLNRTCHNLTRTCHNLNRTCHNLTRTCQNLTRTCHNLTRACHNLTRACRNLTRTCHNLTRACHNLTRTCLLKSCWR